MYCLFIAAFISYTLSLMYLVKQGHKFFKQQQNVSASKQQTTRLFKSFFKYGAPLSLWFIFSYLFSYIDKFFMYKYMGAEAQGNYQAIFDLLYKSISLLISPVITSMFPILTAAYEKEDKSQIRKFIRKIMYYELSGFLISGILYWAFGAKILLYILKIPDTFSFRLSGFIIICGTFVLQLAILAQKRFELKFNTLYLLLMSAITFVIQVIFYLVLKHLNNPLIYPLGFLLATVVYLFLISFTELLSFSKSIKLRLKYRP
jgi:O-antigen/teichoic acid export membrane protein